MSPLHEDFPAMLYTGLWPLTLDGRFQEASRGQHFSILFYFHDWPPAILLRIDDGKFTIEPCNPNTTVVDGRVEGNFADAATALDSIGSAFKLLVSRKIKLVNKRVLLKLARIFLSKRLPRPEGHL
jgi:hypothetical protein